MSYKARKFKGTILGLNKRTGSFAFYNIKNVSRSGEFNDITKLRNRYGRKVSLYSISKGYMETYFRSNSIEPQLPGEFLT